MRSSVDVIHLIGSTGLYGAERWILALLHHLSSERVHSTVVNLVDRPDTVSDLVTVARQRGIAAIDLPTGGRFNPFGAIRLARLVRERQCAVLHSHGYKADVLALLAGRLAGVTVMSTPHGWSRERDRRLAFYESVGRFALRYVDYVCPLSPELRDRLRLSGVAERKIRFIANAVDIDEVDSVPLAGERREGETVVGYVGQLIQRKNVGCLLDAFARVADQRADVRLVIVGDGPLGEELRRTAATLNLLDRVRFTGYRPDGIAMLKTFDVVVLPSWEEGVPRCLMEAMAAGVPVVASDIRGNGALVRDGDTGLLFPPGDPAALAAALVDIIEAPERRKLMVDRARERVVRDFSARRMAADYAALYERC